MFKCTIETDGSIGVTSILDSVIENLKEGFSSRIKFSNGSVITTLSAEDADDHEEHICLWRNEDDISYSSPMINLRLSDFSDFYTNSDCRLNTFNLFGLIISNLLNNMYLELKNKDSK